MPVVTRNIQLFKFSLYGFLKNLTFFEPFLLLFFLEKGLSFTQIGILYGFREIIINVFEIPSGIFADIIGKKKTMVLSLLGYMLSFLVFFFSSSLFLFLPAMLLFGFGEACRTGTHKAMIFEYLKQRGQEDQKTAYYGITRSWSQVGSAVSALVAGIIVFWQGSYKYVFLYSTIPYFLDLILILTYPASLDGEKHSGIQDIKQSFVAIIKETSRIFSSLKVFRLIGNQALHSGFYKASKDFIQPVLRTIALGFPFLVAYSSEQRSSVFIGIMYFFIYLLTSYASRYAPVFVSHVKSSGRALNITLMAGAIAGFVAGLLNWTGITIISVIVFLCIFLLENLRKPVGIAYVSDTIQPKALATTLSALSQAQSFATAGISMVLGVAIDTLGIGPGLTAVFGALGIISLFFMVETTDKNE